MAAEVPLHLRQVVYTVPNVDQMQVHHDVPYPAPDGTTLLLDVYAPASPPSPGPLPGIVFIHGGPVPRDLNIKESGQYRGWGALAATAGFIGFTFNHRYFAPELLEQSVHDVLTTVDYVRTRAEDLSLDPERLCIWACSGGGPHLAPMLRDQPTYLRCIVSYYAYLDARQMPALAKALDAQTLERYSPITYLTANTRHCPILVARAGLDNPVLNQTIDDFALRAFTVNWNVEILNHAEGHHGFDVTDDNKRSRDIIARTLAFMQEHAQPDAVSAA